MRRRLAQIVCPRREAIYLVPLRIFIGLGWLRAAVEKLVASGWYDGSAVRSFCEEQMASGLVLPPYEPLLSALHEVAAPIGIGVMVLELVIGVAILLGAATRSALLVGLFLNANFILAGETNPSVFYILIELTLLAGGAGSILGVDALRSARARISALHLGHSRARVAVTLIAGAAVLGAAALTQFITTTAPARVIEDPALILITLLLLVAGGAVVLMTASWRLKPASERHHPLRSGRDRRQM